MVKIGDVIPADARIIPGWISSLENDEALLTGESLPSVKQEEAIEDPDCPVGECVQCTEQHGSLLTPVFSAVESTWSIQGRKWLKAARELLSLLLAWPPN